jgi:hypothetical protein
MNYTYAENINSNSNSNSNNNNNNIQSSNSFNIAIAADWGCEEDAKKTSQNIQEKNPELVITPGDLSYEGSSQCWVDIISPFKSKLMISMGDHEYQDTEGGISGVINDYLYPLDLPKTYYAFDFRNVHFVAIDPYIDYEPGSAQYQFIENDLKTAASDPEIDWIFAMEHVPIYTSPTKHPADPKIRDVFHPLFDKYGVDIVFSGDNHNYQRTFPLKYNDNNNGDSSNPTIVSSTTTHNYKEDTGVIYAISGTAGRSHYEISQQAPFVAKQDDKNFGFLNIDIDDKTVKGTFYANEVEEPSGNYQYVSYKNNVIDHFTISKENKLPTSSMLDKLSSFLKLE